MAFFLSCRTVFNRLMDIIYPPRCHICQCFLGEKGHHDQSICRDCQSDFTHLTSPLCPICSKTFESLQHEDHVCEECLRKRPHYDALGAPYAYDGKIMDAVHQLKYGGKTYLARSLGSILASFAIGWLNTPRDLLMMPVPLHPKKLRKRGFNQSLLLAREVQSRLAVELDFLSFKRIRNTQSQTGLKRDERRRNVRGAFHMDARKNLKGQAILLVDDVATTTSTLNECARVLKKAGGDKVFCLVLARALG